MSNTDLAALFGADPSKEVKGVVVQYGPIRIRLARVGGANLKFKKLFEEKMRPWRAMQEAGMMPDEEAQRIIHESFAEGIILDWEGIEDDGEQVPFTVENAVKLFQKWPGFFAFCNAEAGKLSNFQTADTESDSKNL